jgi:hypothetical protein
MTTQALPTPGSVWLDISPRGRGETAYVKAVTPLKVQFTVRNASRDCGQVFSQPIEKFLAAHTLKTPGPKPKPRKEPIKHMPKPPRITNVYDQQTRLVPKAEFSLDLSPSTPVPADPAMAAPTKGWSRKARLGYTEAREIYTMVCRHGIHPVEVGEAYGVSRDVVDKITAGVNYASATYDLRIAWPRPLSQPEPQEPGPQAEAAPEPTPEPIVQAEPQPEPKETDVPIIQTVPREQAQVAPKIHDDQKLLSSLADAIDVLIAFKDGKLPPFMTLDVTSIQDLAVTARRRAATL